MQCIPFCSCSQLLCYSRCSPNTHTSCKIPLLEPQGVADCDTQRALPTGLLRDHPKATHPKSARHLLYVLTGASAMPGPELLALLAPKGRAGGPPAPKHTRMCTLLRKGTGNSTNPKHTTMHALQCRAPQPAQTPGGELKALCAAQPMAVGSLTKCREGCSG